SVNSASMQLDGRSLIARKHAPASHKVFRAVSPLTGIRLQPEFHEATRTDVDHALRQAEEAFEHYRRMPETERADFLDMIANEIAGISEKLLGRANAETGLPMERLTAERGRTCGQIKT